MDIVIIAPKPLKEGVVIVKWSKETGEEFMKKFIQWFKEQNIKQIILTPDGKLKIEYHDNKPKEELSSQQIDMQPHKQQLNNVKEYLQKTNKKSFDEQKLNDLEKKLNNLTNEFLSTEKPKDYKVLWVSLGGIGLLVIGGLLG
ncbi:24913_t:CDS:2 [Entrophospora sp. SA101]|nr:14082_t:CDS:2 [Entrophospora sp. SA101]CAJ0747059.1 24913_t:CDS:2 [Entrophospora sp. SA101]CAJ0830351.1 1834_t:CDS:2 [Entrophospora sp. SA101]CAJ0836336.1 2066_t:CDS:2 [Entrophospora sp. SA101]